MKQRRVGQISEQNEEIERMKKHQAYVESKMEKLSQEKNEA